VDEMGRACTTHEVKRNGYRNLVVRPEGKTPIGRPRRMWEDIIKCVLGRYAGVVWTGFVWLMIGTGGWLS
jgi:hypothetical protein